MLRGYFLKTLKKVSDQSFHNNVTKFQSIPPHIFTKKFNTSNEIQEKSKYTLTKVFKKILGSENLTSDETSNLFENNVESNPSSREEPHNDYKKFPSTIEQIFNLSGDSAINDPEALNIPDSKIIGQTDTTTNS
jgi:hypothetical protein